jgi:hypothetical protein
LRFTLSQPKVEQDYAAAIRRLQVLWFNVAMNNRWPMGMQVFQGIEKLAGPFQDLFAFKGPAPELQLRCKVLAGYEFHYQKLAATFDEVVADARQSWVAEGGEQTRFPLECSGQLLVAEESLFQCNAGSESQVHGLIHRTHSAMTDHFHYLVSILEHSGGREHKSASGV